MTLAHQLSAKLLPGDVVLANRVFGSYVDLVLVQHYSADGVFRKHQSRKSNFRRSKKLGIGNHTALPGVMRYNKNRLKILP